MSWPADWGWDAHFERVWVAEADEEPMRVTAEFRGGYLVQSAHGELKAGASGKLRRAIKRDGADKPAVGDWVTASARAAEGSALIHGVLPRRTCVRRRASGRDAKPQVIAANVDVVLIASALDGDLSPRRLERYLAVVKQSGARGALVLTKADLCADVPAELARVAEVAPDVPVHLVDPRSGGGAEALDGYFAGGATVTLVGSSGVGKSTLINRWLGDAYLPTAAVREDGRGRHTTTHREIFVRPAGGLVMDTPGMRELGLWEADEALGDTFAEVAAVAASCKYNDCRHGGEPGCAVQEALAAGTLERARVEAWKKLSGEMKASEADAARIRKRNERVQGKALKRMQKDRGD